jgi:uncharacterized repeat protein (TIGR03803 family)
MKTLTLHRYLSIVSALVLFVVCPLLPAQTYTDLYNFNNSDGCCANYPSLLAQGEDGNIYGATTSGGSGFGNIFRISPAGTFNSLFNFNGTDGIGPQGGLSLGLDGNFYGTTYQGGTGHAGTIFKITPAGAQTVLYNFTNTTDGAFPRVPPVQAPDGNLYGTTGNGTVAVLYKITPSGAFTVMANLPSQSYSPLLLGTDGNLYGMTLLGGTFNRGTAFQYAPAKKKLKIIHNFGTGTEGYSPAGPLFQGVDGKLYGTATVGGTSAGGTVFQMSTGGKVVTLVNFDASHPANGATPFAGVVQGSDGFLYGVASVGGANGLGTLFKVSTKGTGFTVLHDFLTATGDSPLSTPLLHTNGKIYGLAFHGGSHTAYGAVYSYDAGLKPFVSQFVYYSGKVGASVGILGQGFSNATGVKFGAGVGTFVASTDAFMTATVAAGATTGVITVLEPGGNLSSPQKYKIIPTISSFSPKSGPVGTVVTITGMSLKQTSSVTIGKVKAAFTVVSDTQVTATVAAGAVTGKVTLKTPGGTATGPGNFTVQ